jgi:hypothetical protein
MVEPVSIGLALGAAALYRAYYPPLVLKDDRPREEKDFSAAQFRALPLREDDPDAICVRRGNWVLVSCKGCDERNKKGFYGSCFVVRWLLQVDQKDCRIELIHGQISGKKRVYLNSHLVHESMTFIDSGMDILLPDILHTSVPISCIILVDDYSGDWIYDLRVGEERIDHVVESRHQNQQSDGVELGSIYPPSSASAETDTPAAAGGSGGPGDGQ